MKRNKFYTLVSWFYCSVFSWQRVRHPGSSDNAPEPAPTEAAPEPTQPPAPEEPVATEEPSRT